ncbi:hypothetical protein [Qipengyuania gaetbuli]|uniref:hypothetical protein n=1 Tax=Qipengyuania gaetbuli TaxID=266952 RepID=UPI001CFF2541|nr:hypothetical protein [Qipengyuania gaetbuli]
MEKAKQAELGDGEISRISQISSPALGDSGNHAEADFSRISQISSHPVADSGPEQAGEISRISQISRQPIPKSGGFGGEKETNQSVSRANVANPANPQADGNRESESSILGANVANPANPEAEAQTEPKAPSADDERVAIRSLLASAYLNFGIIVQVSHGRIKLSAMAEPPADVVDLLIAEKPAIIRVLGSNGRSPARRD